MPNGKQHDRITHITAPIIGVGVFGVLTNIKNGVDLMSALILTLILMSAYYFSSLMFNGDLDTNSRPYNRWWLFKMLWVPYQVMFKHRSFWTHGIIVGTVVRLLYLSPLIVLIFVTFNLSINWFYIIPLLVGLELGNTVHTVSDAIG